MDFSIMTASFPLDEETFQEVSRFCEEAGAIDEVEYDTLPQLSIATNTDQSGFYLLAYDDNKDGLVGAVAAVDLLGLGAFEWTGVVLPNYRKRGIGNALFAKLEQALEMRGAVGNLASIWQQSPHGKIFLENKGYQYNSSLCTFTALSQIEEIPHNCEIRPFQFDDTAQVQDIFCASFDDTAEEAQELIQYSQMAEHVQFIVAVSAGRVVGTLTLQQEKGVQYIVSFAVHPIARRKGIGSALLQWAKNSAAQQGSSRIFLEVETDNEAALAFYNKFSFDLYKKIDFYTRN